MNPHHQPFMAFQNWEETVSNGGVAGVAEHFAAALLPDARTEDDVPDDFVEEEHGASSFKAFEIPKGPWADVNDAVTEFSEAANSCSHRFKCCHYSCAHYVSGQQGLVQDWKYLYCCCNKAPSEGAVKHHSKSYCMFDVRLKLDKKAGLWHVHGKPNLNHCCQPLPDLSITATGMRLLRDIKELTPPEVLFIQHQFEFVGVIPRVIQWNFTRAFPNRKPTGNLISRMRVQYQEGVYGFKPEHVEQLMKDLRRFNEEGGIGEISIDTCMKISRLVVVRPDMMPFLKKYSRVLICDATHGITMTGFKLFTVVCVDALLHSALVAYAFVRSEQPHLGQNVVFISDDNPAASLMCHHFGFTHLLCQWHYAKAFVKNCKTNRILKQDFSGFATMFAHLLRGTKFDDDTDFENQMNHFVASVEHRCPAMSNWIKQFQRDRQLVCEYFRKGLFTAG